MNNVIRQAMKNVLEQQGLPIGTFLENMVTWRLHRSRLLDKYQYPVGPYRLDYAWPKLKIGLEADGPHHWQPNTAIKDVVRDSFLRSQGWLILRIDNETETLDLQLQRVISVINMAQEVSDADLTSPEYRLPRAVRDLVTDPS